MFERYTERARRVVFFARYEASVFGSSCIDTEHLLLGLVREGGGLVNRIFQSTGVTRRLVQERIEAGRPRGLPTSTAVDIPLSPAAKRALQHAADEAEGLTHDGIAPEELLLGLLHEHDSMAADILTGKGLRLEEVREEVRLPATAARAPHTARDAFHKFLELIAELNARRASFRVSSFGREGLRVEVPGPDGTWTVTFYADARVVVEASSRPGELEGEAALGRLLDRLGPPHRTDG
jgi:ATP-dependent Clp protease ATP-binding subunit ClpA